MYSTLYRIASQAILCTDGSNCETPLRIPKVDASQSTLADVLKVVFGVVAVLSVIYITFAGLKYVTAQGDPGALTKARNGIIYGVIGLAVALSAFAIVAFTIGKVSS